MMNKQPEKQQLNTKKLIKKPNKAELETKARMSFTWKKTR